MKKISFLLLLLLGVHGYNAAKPQEDSDEQTVSKLSIWLNSVLDFATVYYMTYTGDQNAQVQNVSQQLIGKLGDNFETIFNEMELDWMGMVGPAKEFKNTTGLHLYLVPRINTFDPQMDSLVWKEFEGWNQKRIEDPVAPYLIVQPIINGSKAQGYTVDVQLTVSDEINPRTYNLKVDDSNVFQETFKGWQSKERKKLLKDLKTSILGGIQTWQDALGDNFVPPLGITIGTERHSPNETIEVSHREDYWEELTATDAEGNMISSEAVEWEIIPFDDLSETILTKNGGEQNGSKIQNNIIKINNKNPLKLPSWAFQSHTYWDIKAMWGREECEVTYEVEKVDLNLDWKEIVKGLIKQRIDSLLAKAEKKAEEMLENLKSNQTKFHQEVLSLKKNYLYSSNILEAEVIEYQEDDTETTTYYELDLPNTEEYSKIENVFEEVKKVMLDESLKEIRKVALLAILNPDGFKKLSAKIIADIPVNATSLITILIQGGDKTEIFEYLEGYINDLLDDIIKDKLGGFMAGIYDMINQGKGLNDIKNYILDSLEKEILKQI